MSEKSKKIIKTLVLFLIVIPSIFVLVTMLFCRDFNALSFDLMVKFSIPIMIAGILISLVIWLYHNKQEKQKVSLWIILGIWWLIIIPSFLDLIPVVFRWSQPDWFHNSCLNQLGRYALNLLVGIPIVLCYKEYQENV